MGAPDREPPTGGRHALAHGTLRASVATSTGAGAVLVVLGLAASWLLTYAAGGADVAVPHLYYLPILFAAARFGAPAALLVAVVATVLAGPLTDVDVATGLDQETARWLTRGAFFVFIGQVMAWLVTPSLPTVTEEIRRARDERELRRAIERDELFLRYQPLESLSGGHTVGFEALARWRHPSRGELGPGAFLPTAEQGELIHALGAHVLDAACVEAARWRDRAQATGRVPPFVTVNLSGRELEETGLADRVWRSLERHRLPASQLCLEVTETALVADVEASARQLHRLRALGVRLAIDDFGTGYSSFAYLARFPVDLIKVDRTFLSALGRDEATEALAGGLVLLARSLGLHTVAEGVETADQAATVAELGYDLAQGFHIAHPLDAEDVARLLDADRAPVWLARSGE